MYFFPRYLKFGKFVVFLTMIKGCLAQYRYKSSFMRYASHEELSFSLSLAVCVQLLSGSRLAERLGPMEHIQTGAIWLYVHVERLC